MAKSDRQAWDEMVAVRRRKQGLDENPAPKKEKKEPIKPVGFKANVQHIWYHYKGAILVGLAFFIIIAYGIYDIATQTKYDLVVLLVTSDIYIPDEEREYLVEKFTPYVEDVSGNGEIEICIVNIFNLGKDASASQKFTANLGTGEIAMIITDDTVYDKQLKESSDMLVSLKETYGEKAQLSLNDFRYTLKGSVLLQNINENDVLNKLSISVRDLSTLGQPDCNIFSTDPAEGLRSYEQAMRILNALMEEEPEAAA